MIFSSRNKMSSYILPTLFSIFIAVWYYVLMAELLVLEDVPLHVFCSIARAFYGGLVSFPYDTTLKVILSRIILWVVIFVMALDVVQLVLILNRFNSFVLADAFSVLFSCIFILLDLFFILNLYHMSTENQLELRKPKPKKQVQQLETIPEISIDQLREEKTTLKRRIRF